MKEEYQTKKLRRFKEFLKGEQCSEFHKTITLLAFLEGYDRGYMDAKKEEGKG